MLLAVRVGDSAGAVSWQCAWWRLGAGLGAGCVCGGDRVPDAGRWVGARCAGYILVLGAGAGCRELACRCSVLVPASHSEVITITASDSEG